eukprot:gene11996-1992_t
MSVGAAMPSGAGARAASPLPELPPPGRRTPAMLASEAKTRADGGSGHRLISRLYSQVDGNARAGQCGMPNILSAGAAASAGAKRRDDDAVAGRRSSGQGRGTAPGSGPDPHSQTTSLNLLRQAQKGKGAAVTIGQPRRVKLAELRDQLRSAKTERGPPGSPSRGRPAPRPDTALTS